jgi:hypothetical protein
MIRFLRAFAWLRWRLMLNGLRGARRRDTLEQISRLLALIVPVLIVVTSLGSLAIVSVGGYMGGHALTTETFAGSREVILIARGLLLVVTLLVMFMPVGGAAQTTSNKYSRLLLLPIPVRGLHLVEVLAGLADPWVMFILPGLVLFAVGFAAGGWFGVAALVLLAGLVLAVLFASLGSLVSFLVSWLFRDRRRAEVLTVIFILAISAVALVPQLIGMDQNRRRRDDEAAGRPRLDMTVARFEGALPAWTRVVPSEAFGVVVARAAIEGRPGAAAGWIGVLAAEALALFWLSGLVHQRLLHTAGGSSSRRRRAVALVRPWRLPGVSAPAAAVAWVMVRASTRSVRGRIAVLLPGPMLALVSLVTLRTPEEGFVAFITAQSHLAFGSSLMFGLLAIQPFTMNQFASDRTGLTQQWLLPISAADLVRGKAIGGGVLFLLAMVVSALAIGLALGVTSPMAWLMMALGGLAIYISITPGAALLSAWFPVPADLSKPGSGGNPHTASAMIGMLLVVLAAIPVAGIVIPGLFAVMSPVVSLLLMVTWLGVVTAIAWPMLGLASRAVTARHENLFLTIAK